MRAAAFFQMTHPGVPIIYYGDELGMRGGDDPDCRRSMEWQKVEKSSMLAYYKRLTQMRAHLRVLREGTFKTQEVGADGLYAYLRRTDEETALCLLNTSGVRIKRSVALPEALAKEKELCDAMTGRTVHINSSMVNISLAAGVGMVLTRKREK